MSGRCGGRGRGPRHPARRLRLGLRPAQHRRRWWRLRLGRRLPGRRDRADAERAPGVRWHRRRRRGLGVASGAVVGHGRWLIGGRLGGMVPPGTRLPFGINGHDALLTYAWP
ncbi:hypothetical protein [Cryptosporangium aurantiacum]|uniref:hypothetical protein n=1 Tax=Cryptosporangium aurantiacum TaxID=134849 RepID=UPI0011610263|nr:hypothetical protein [Cryptosporangium aurantiacum]